MYHATLKHTPPETPETVDPNAVYHIKIPSAVHKIMYRNMVKCFYRKFLNFRVYKEYSCTKKPVSTLLGNARVHSWQ